MSYRKSSYQVLKDLNVDPNKGLSVEEVHKRRQLYGKNELIEEKKQTLFAMFLQQLKDPMVCILVLGASISIILNEILDSIIILTVILMNAIIGVIQEYKAEKAMEALKQLASFKAHVIRGGFRKEIKASSLVVGDIVELEPGGYIPADLRLIASKDLKVEESTLTGESEPILKDATTLYAEAKEIAEQKNMVFMTCCVTYGKARGVVVATGMNTEVGKIAKMLAETKQEATPLQQRLQHLSKVLGILCLIICVSIFLIALIQGKELFETLLISISLAVAAIPEGLPAVVTIVLALGVQKMSQNNTIVRKLHAVETLGCVSVVCSDKTGTLTQNKMRVMECFSRGKYEPCEALYQACTLCNNCVLQEDEIYGEPTEKALVVFSQENNYKKTQLEKEYVRIDEIEFDSNRKKMTTVHANKSSYIAYSKGAIERILEQCRYVLKEEGVIPLTEYEKENIMQVAQTMSLKALRVLGFAYRNVKRFEFSSIEEDMTFIGMVGMIDPPRSEAKQAIEICKQAGIQVSMITGDHPNTAFAIAQQLNIASSKEEVITGTELDALSDEELKHIIENKRVFARVTPEHKVRIIGQYQSLNHIVSMSGDGVNDAPSLKKADIGLAMGEGGSDVCKQASDIILTDDNFATIVKAIEEGRNIYQNIQKAVLYLLSCNLGEIMLLMLAVVLMPYAPSPLSAIQILWVNLVTDAFPALALGADPKNKFIMKDKPRDPFESLFSKGGLSFTILNGMLIGTISLVAFCYGYQESYAKGQTMAFMVLSISQLVHAFNLRARTRSIFQVGVCKNKWLVFTFVISIILQILVVHIPLFQTFLKTSALSMLQWGIVIALSSSLIVVNEASKWVANVQEQ